jgi:DinB superfamily
MAAYKAASSVVMRENWTFAKIQAHKTFFHRTTCCLDEHDATFQPRSDMFTVVGQILHVTAAIEFFLSGLFLHMDRFKGREWTSRRGRGEQWVGLNTGFSSMEWTQDASRNYESGDAAQSLKGALRAFDETMDIASDVFGQLPREELVRPLPENPMGFLNPQHVLEIMLDHTAHHRGAIAQYARLLGKDPKIPYFEMSEAGLMAKEKSFQL